MKDDNSIFFLTIALLCVWLIVDWFVGKKYVQRIILMMPFMTKETPEAGKVFQEKYEEANADGTITWKESQEIMESVGMKENGTPTGFGI